MGNLDREREITDLTALYGTPLRQRCLLDVSQASQAWWSTEKARRRDGEVALFIQRPCGELILHTKDFYPNGVMRVPTGGIKQGEAVVDALVRETLEETGLQVTIQRFLALVEFELQYRGQVIPYPSYCFLLREVAGELMPLDAEERIAAFAQVPCHELLAVAAELESVPAEWQDWGQFRAIPHRLVARLLSA